ncbi:hypothetical protein BDA99DRAFT_554663 [Phascolomyces articulosus]|uniref:Ubiquitin-like domain-containing protein n=1 Tax=Phascolomyces articulosus TaxID=60185 RepID=A0AAD5PJF8_9FUNG|nr:hypothetical protein BDA99DRAFT_554663 [Phascolomyces articulosus]
MTVVIVTTAVQENGDNVVVVMKKDATVGYLKNELYFLGNDDSLPVEIQFLFFDCRVLEPNDQCLCDYNGIHNNAIQLVLNGQKRAKEGMVAHMIGRGGGPALFADVSDNGGQFF